MPVDRGRKVWTGETPAPFRNDSGSLPILSHAGEEFVPDRKELGSVVKNTAPEAAGRHAAPDSPALVDHESLDPRVSKFSCGR
jgi:hypothetical protein